MKIQEAEIRINEIDNLISGMNESHSEDRYERLMEEKDWMQEAMREEMAYQREKGW
jgi:hypothetical protein